MLRILFVCHGNICRSPMGEFILKDLVNKQGLTDKYYIESAAVSEEELGNPIYPPAKRCLKQHGIWFDPCKTARRITRDDYASFDRIICMDHSNLHWLFRIVGEDADNKVCLLMSYCESGNDVADPWYTGDFELTYHDILAGCKAMLKADGYDTTLVARR